MSIKRRYFYTDIAELLHCEVSSVRNMKYRGEFKIAGYQRVGRWKKYAFAYENEVKKLMEKKMIPPK